MEDRLSNPNRFCFSVTCRNAINLVKQSWWARLLPLVAVLIVTCSLTSSAIAGEPDRIWTAKTNAAKPTTGPNECFFRKKFTLIGPEKAELIFSAGDEYEIYLNGRLVSRGQSLGESKTVNVTEFIEPGVNLVAARVKHYDSPVPGLSLKFRVKEKSETRWRSLTTDNTWKTRVVETLNWNQNAYSDTGWIAANSTSAAQVAEANQKVLDQAKAAAALAEQEQAAKDKLAAENKARQAKNAQLEASSAKFTKSTDVTKKKTQNKLTRVGQKKTQTDTRRRFDVGTEFAVGKVFSAEETGSLIAMEFNEFGKLLLSREGGHLMIADPTKPANDPNRMRVYCDEVKSCRGILPLNGSVYVTAKSHNGLGLYELNHLKNKKKLTVARQLLSFSEVAQDNGPQGIQLGPEGMLYVVVGNNCEVKQTFAPTSPLKNFHDAVLVPELRDRNRKTPGGSIVRVSLDGKTVERVAGGIHSTRDLVVVADGEMFLHDSDTRSDMGLSSHRPARVYHVPAGADLGWRGSWSSFPDYFVDGTPAMATTDTASPTGAVQYKHIQFPHRYHGSIFFADWAEGRILTVKPLPDGAGFTGKPQPFLSGRPLNVSDLAVGKDGHLYFCTGGRGTEGGVYRVSWKGKAPAALTKYKNDLDLVLRFPQPDSAWARQDIAQLRIKMGRQWNNAIEEVALDTSQPTKRRIRALQLMGLYGPLPNRGLLRTLQSDKQPAVRAQVARLCLRKPEVFKEEVVLNLVKDKNSYVRRVACEACVRLDVKPSFESLVPMLVSDNRVEALAARRLLERIPSRFWQDKVVNADDKRLFINGAVALLSQEPTLEQGYEVLAKSSHLMDGFLTDNEFVDLLRVVQLALTQCDVQPGRVDGLTKRVVSEFPTASSSINRELARVLGYLKAGDFSGRLETYLVDENVLMADRIHVSMHLVNGQDNLTSNEKVSILNTLETSLSVSSTSTSHNKYVQRAIKKISGAVAGSDISTVLANGHRWPKTVLTAFYKMPEKLDRKTVDAVIAMDQRMVELGSADEATEQVRLGVIAILARDGSETGMQYLRELWLQEPDRRSDLVIGLSQQPEGENWAYLVGTLPKLDDLTAVDVLRRLTSIAQRPKESLHYQQVIEVGYRLRGQGAHLAANLLQHWSGQPEVAANKSSNWKVRLSHWSGWYETRFPEGQTIAVDANQKKVGRYSVAEIVDQIANAGPGDASAGRHIFAKANCAACHRIGNHGQGGGPDLTNMTARFSLREAVEATIDPSAVVSQRYRSKEILTADGITHQGIEINQVDGTYVLLNNQGKRIRVDANDVKEIGSSGLSAMPEGMLDNLSMTEIRDLMAYLTKQSEAMMAENTEQPEGPAARIGAMPSVEKIR